MFIRIMRRAPLLAAFLLAPVSAFAADGTEKISYEEHVRPILRQHCFSCHNQNEKKGGLALDSYASTMEGGAGGEVVFDGDGSASRIWQLMAHEDTPIMPPGQDKLPGELIDTVKAWIDGGLLENAGSKAKKKKTNALAFSSSADGKPEGPPPMPETVWKQPSVTTDRPAAATSIRTSPWAPLVAIGGQDQVILYNTDSGELVGVLPFPEGEPQSLSFSRDGGYLLVGGGRHSAQGVTVLYDIRTGDRVGRAGDELDIVLGSDIHPDLSRVALGGPQRLVRIHDLATGAVAIELKKHTDWVYSVRYSPDGVLVASGDRAGGLVLWESDTGRLYLDLVGHKDGIRGIAWRSDSNVVASASMDGTVKLWDVLSGREIKNIAAHGSGVTGIDMAKDGRIVTCGKDGTVKLWDANGNAVRDLPAFPESALEVSFTYDDAGVIAGDWTGKFQGWKTADATPLYTLASNPQTLETRIASAQQHSDQALAVFNERNTAFLAIEADLNTTLAQMNDIAAKLDALRPLATAAEAKRVELQTMADASTAALVPIQEAMGPLQTRVADATKSTNEMAATQGALEGKIKELEASSKAATDARDTAAKSIEEIDAQVVMVQGVEPIDNEKLVALQTQRAGVAKVHAEQVASFETNQQELTSVKEQLRVLNESLRPAQEQLLAAQRELSELQTKVATARELALSSSAAAKVATAEATGLANQVVQMEPQLAELQKAVAEKTPKRDEARVALEPIATAKDTAAVALAQLQADLAAFQGQRSQLETAQQAVEAKLTEATAIAEAKKASAAELANRYTAEETRLAEVQKQLAALQAEVEALMKSKNEMLAAEATALETAELAEAEKAKLVDRKALFDAAYPPK